MRTTRRLLEAEARSSVAEPSPRDTDTARRTRRPIAARVPALLALVTSLATVAGMTTSCSSSDDDAREPLPGDADGGADSAPEAEREDVIDAGIADVVVVDSAPLRIECKEPPCAIALSTTTTTFSSPATNDEGYCALLDDGTVACWGANADGQLGNPEAIGASPVPMRVSGLSKVTALDHTCAVDSDGSVFCWGRGPFLQSEASVQTVETSPVRLPLPGPATKVAFNTFSNSYGVGCAILRDGSVVCWGSNAYWQLGEGVSQSVRNAQPLAIERAFGAKDIAVGNATFAIDGDGAMKSWGSAIGIGRPIALDYSGWPTNVALDHVSMLDTIGGEACAVANGIGWCWGPNDERKAAFGTTYARALPSAVDTPEPITRIATSRTVRGSVDSVLYFHRRRWCATSVTGAVYCWGLNNAGQAGDGTKEFALEPVQVAGLPAPAAEVKVMPYSTCAILTNGKVYCWGSNFYGQLGAGLPRGSVLQPVEVKLP
ncbi:MAG: hypothetical protein BGO98_17525 [Myxococcales bacterium 68-20]|nr:MAG: hypothetical protein BGO98_17525 [Myxococcales bacterium 68-20]